MECRPNCGMCCIAASITSPIFGMPQGKPAGEPCINLDPVTLRCHIWGTAVYPRFCQGFVPCLEVCGHSREEALILISTMEQATKPTQDQPTTNN